MGIDKGGNIHRGLGNNIGVWDSEYIYIDIGIIQGVSGEYVIPYPEVPSKAFFSKNILSLRFRGLGVIYFEYD